MELCEKYQTLISAAVDGELPPKQRGELMEHLAQCPACREIFDQTMAMHMVFSQLDTKVPGDLTADVMAKVRAQRQIKKPRNHWWQMAAAAACLALVVVGYQHLRPQELPKNAADPATFSADALEDEAPSIGTAAADAAAADEGGAAQYAPEVVQRDAPYQADAADEAMMEDVLTYFRSSAPQASATALLPAESGETEEQQAEEIPCPTLSSAAPELEAWLLEHMAAEGYSTDGGQEEAWLLTAPEYEALVAYLDGAGIPYDLEGAEGLAQDGEAVVCVVYLAPEEAS